MVSVMKKFLAFVGYNLMRPWLHLYAFDTPLSLYRKSEIIKSYEMFKEHFAGAMIFDNPNDFRNWVIDSYASNLGASSEKFLNLEFGVYKARTTNLFANRLKTVDGLLYGFDSFEGLEDDWVGSINGPKGTFSLNGSLPKVEKNVRLIKGLVQDTLGSFLSREPGTIGFVHLDLDTYDSTKFVLMSIKPRLQSGSVIIFDELYGYPGFENHELKALKEVLSDVDYRYLSFSTTQAAIQIV